MATLKNNAFTLLVCIALLQLSSMVATTTTGLNYDNRAVERRFKSWLQRNNKHYKNKDEWMLRFGIYHANLNFVDYFNSLNLSFTLGDNEFADLTNDEFKALYVGRLNLLRSEPHSRNLTVSVSHALVDDLPRQVDWREKGAVNHVKNQGQCGSCWAFSAVGAIESLNQIKTGKLVSLSEQELVDCDRGENLGCKGGLMDEAFKYIKNNNGISAEQDYPYTGSDGACKAPGKKAVQISGYKTVAQNSEESLMAAVAQQPVSVALESSGFPFQLYSKGIFSGQCGTSLDHGVVAVGYGEDDDGHKYWIVRNSWGPTWGEQGYMRMLRGANEPEGTCGIAMMASYPLAA